jgi:hypothetical protein
MLPVPQDEEHFTTARHSPADFASHSNAYDSPFSLLGLVRKKDRYRIVGVSWPSTMVFSSYLPDPFFCRCPLAEAAKD